MTEEEHPSFLEGWFPRQIDNRSDLRPLSSNGDDFIDWRRD